MLISSNVVTQRSTLSKMKNYFSESNLVEEELNFVAKIK